MGQPRNIQSGQGQEACFCRWCAAGLLQLKSIGKKAAAIAINQAKIDVAEEVKKGDIGASQADMQKRIQVTEYNSKAVKGENTAAANIASYNADLGEKEAEAKRRGEVARQVAQAEIQVAKATAESRRLEVDQVVPQEIEKRRIEIDAEAVAQRKRKEAQGEADAILALRTAEAQGIKKVLDAKAEGYRELVKSCGQNAKDAATILVVEKLQDIVKLQIEAIRNLKIDKITVWDSGSGEKGSSTANFASSLIKSLPALHDVAQMAGLDLPDYLGEMTSEKPQVQPKPRPKPTPGAPQPKGSSV